MFDADKYYDPEKRVKLGGRVFEVPIIPAITSFIINRNRDAYGRFGTKDEDEESRRIAFEVIASILNQRVSKGKTIDADWVGNHLDMRVMNDFLNVIFGGTDQEEKKTAQENEGDG